MKGLKFTDSQIALILRQAEEIVSKFRHGDVLRWQGMTAADAIRHIGITSR